MKVTNYHCGEAPTETYGDMLDKNNIKYKLIEDIKIYPLDGMYGGHTYNLYKYTRKNGDKVVACVTGINLGDECDREVILITLDDNEEYNIDKIKNTIICFNKK